MTSKEPDKVMAKAREVFKASGITLDELGAKMGYTADARQSAWQFLSKTTDPRISMLRRFAEAMGVPVVELFGEHPAKKKGRSK
jgi:transcriptional regulator with XRE-family HTH domain